MHLGNGAITTGCAAVTYGAATVGLGFAVAAMRRAAPDRERLLAAGALTGTIFAAQMINVPVLPFSSAHLVGGVLAAWVLGPPLGALSMSVVLLGQALLLGDGGLLALGANNINMGLLPALLVHVVRDTKILQRRGRATAGITAAAAIAMAAILIVGEVVLFRGAGQTEGLISFAMQIVSIHLWIAVPEGLLTVAILVALGGVAAPGRVRLDQTRIGACWGAAAVMIVCLLPFSSPMPDGYESAVERTGMAALLVEADNPAALASTGKLNAAAAAWQARFVSRIQEAIANEQFLALLATGTVGLTAWGLASLARGLRLET
jgi:cobalt/nickel transport system permease protein